MRGDVFMGLSLSCFGIVEASSIVQYIVPPSVHQPQHADNYCNGITFLEHHPCRMLQQATFIPGQCGSLGWTDLKHCADVSGSWESGTDPHCRPQKSSRPQTEALRSVHTVRGGQLQAAQPCRSHTRACPGNRTDHTAAAAEKEEGAPRKGELRRRLNWLVTRRQRWGILLRH